VLAGDPLCFCGEADRKVGRHLVSADLGESGVPGDVGEEEVVEVFVALGHSVT
jgi:hypothetical protein